MECRHHHWASTIETMASYRYPNIKFIHHKNSFIYLKRQINFNHLFNGLKISSEKYHKQWKTHRLFIWFIKTVASKKKQDNLSPTAMDCQGSVCTNSNFTKVCMISLFIIKLFRLKIVYLKYYLILKMDSILSRLLYCKTFPHDFLFILVTIGLYNNIDQVKTK